MRIPGSCVGIAVSVGLVLAPALLPAQVSTVRTQARPIVVAERAGRGWMGISLDINIIGDGSRPGETEIRVLRTVEGSPAAQAGILPGDVIRRIGQLPLTLPAWEKLTSELESGDEVHFAVQGRDRRLRDVYLTAGARPDFTLPSDVSDQLDAVRESFEARLESAQGRWASRDHVRLLISGGPAEAASNRILDQARRNAVAFGYRSRSGGPPPDVPFPSEPAAPAEGEISITMGPRGFLWSFGGDSVQGWSSSQPVLVAPNVEAGGRYSVVLSAESALPFEYLLLSSQEADSLKTAVIRLRTELSTLNEATRTREREILEIITQQARELDETDAHLKRLRSDNNLVSEELWEVAARLAEVGSLERRERERSGRTGVTAPTAVVQVRTVSAGLVGRNFVGGAQLSDLNPGLSEYFGTDRGVLVIDVLRDTPAFRAGLVPGDVVVGVWDTEVESLVAFRSALKEAYARERRATLSLIRKRQPLLVTLSR